MEHGLKEYNNMDIEIIQFFFVQGSPSSGGSQYGGQVRISSCSTPKHGTFILTEKILCEKISLSDKR